MQPSTDEDLDKLPHVIIASDDIWDPTILDHSIDIANDTYHPIMDPTIDEEEFTSVDECTPMTGIYQHHDRYGPNYICDLYHNECMNCLGFDLNTADNSYPLSSQCMIKDQDYEALCPYLLWLSIDHIKQMLVTTTQWFHNTYHIPFHKHCKSCFTTANVNQWNEPVATDTMFSDEPVRKVMPHLHRFSLGAILSTSTYMELLLIMISLIH